MKMITNRVVLTLIASVFSKSVQSCFDFLKCMIPLGHSLPFNFDRFRYILRTTKAKADRLKKNKFKGEEY